MPRQVFTAEEFMKLAEKASECRVVVRADKAKLKLRTPKMLYVYVTSPEEAEKLIKDLKVTVVEL